MVLAMAVITTGCGNGDPILGESDNIKPRVTITSPATTNPGPTAGPAANAAITATFTERMNPTTINTTSFTVVNTTAGGTAVAGVVTYVSLSKVAKFKPTANFVLGDTYTATIAGTGDTPVTDVAGNALAGNQASLPAASNYVWTFIPTLTDVIKPRVSLTVPATTSPGPTSGPAANAAITATFSESMDPATIDETSFTVVNTSTGGLAVAGVVTYVDSSKTVKFKPDFTLAAGDTYTATIAGTGSAPVTDVAGNALAGNQASLPAASNYVWTFIPTAVDVTAPTITLTAPADAATGVELNRSVSATFSEAMDDSTIDTLSFTLAPSASLSALVAGTVNYDTLSKIATLNPTSNLTASTQYTATVVTTTATDLAGNALAAGAVPNPWVFTTGTGLAAGAVALGAAQPYGVLSNTGITLGGGPDSTTGFRVDGDVGISPAGACVGCDSTTVTGSIENGTVAAANAMLALTDAYNDAIGRTVDKCTLVAGGDLTLNPPPACGGTSNGTFKPGLYWSGTSLAIPAGGTITLDAQGDANAVFIFQSESSIGSIGGNTHVVLLNNVAQAKNVFWVAKSSATIGGTTSDFKGTILALIAATVNTGTTMNGRALARGAEVTVQDGAIINVPAP
jgi:hypothetical protein